MNESLTENSLSSNTVCCNWGNGFAERITQESVCLSFPVNCVGSGQSWVQIKDNKICKFVFTLQNHKVFLALLISRQWKIYEHIQIYKKKR